MSTFGLPGFSQQQLVASATTSLAQDAGTYDTLTASGGDVLVWFVAPYNAVAAAGLTTAALVTNHTTPVVILTATALVALTGGVVLPAYVTPFILPSGKKIQTVIVGVGSGSGTLQVAAVYRPLTSGATLA